MVSTHNATIPCVTVPSNENYLTRQHTQPPMEGSYVPSLVDGQTLL